MKKLALVLSLVLMLTFVGCSSKTTMKETDAFRFDSKTGYAYSTAPFGIDTTELESAIGSKLTMVSESPATAPFAYTNYSSEDIVQSADCSGKFDAQFDENGKVYSIVSPMVIKNSSPLAGVDGVFNAIMVTGDCVGDVMFYGKGAGKLPTASAVVADVVDAVKHSDRSKKIFWEKPTENIMADIDSKKFEYFVRTTDSAENVQKIFGKCEFVDNIIDNESAFVTSPLTKSEVEEKLAKLSDVVANIRVMD